MSQNTYMTSNHRVQVKNIAENEKLLSRITSPANAKSLFKIHCGYKNIIRWPIFKIFAGPIATNWDLDADKKILFLPSNSKKFSPKIKNLTSDFTH